MLNIYRLVLSLVRLFIEIYKGTKAEIVRQSRFRKGVTLGRKQIIFVISKYCLSIDLCESVKLGSCTNLLDSKMTFGLTLDWTVSTGPRGLDDKWTKNSKNGCVTYRMYQTYVTVYIILIGDSMFE